VEQESVEVMFEQARSMDARPAQPRPQARRQPHARRPSDLAGSSIVAGTLAEGITSLKERRDEFPVIGSLNLVQSLLRLGLVDRLNLWLFPLLFGSGKQVFADVTVPIALHLSESVTPPQWHAPADLRDRRRADVRQPRHR
jgi:dihydrofolate reductase